MPITKAYFDWVMIRRCGRLMAKAGLNGTAADGTNPDLADARAEALRSLGIEPADPTSIADADFAAVTFQQSGQLFDVGEVRVLESVLGNLNQPDQTADTDNRQDLGKLRDSVEATVARKRAQIERDYGLGARPPTLGSIDLAISGDCRAGGWGDP